MLPKGMSKKSLARLKIQSASFSDTSSRITTTNYQAKYVTHAITAYITITIKAILTVSPTCNELKNFIPKKFKVNQLGIGV